MTSCNRARLRCHRGVLDLERAHPMENITTTMYWVATMWLALGRFFIRLKIALQGEIAIPSAAGEAEE